MLKNTDFVLINSDLIKTELWDDTDMQDTELPVSDVTQMHTKEKFDISKIQ